jgi:DnaJ family protein C protein 2
MIKLVETARDLDPRLRRIAEEAAKNKNAGKALAAKKKAEEKERLAAAQAKRKAEEAAAIAAKDAADAAARELAVAQVKILAGEFKILTNLLATKMPGSKVFDQYWVTGTCKTKIKKAIYAKMLNQRLEALDKPDNSEMQAAFAKLFNEICER